MATRSWQSRWLTVGLLWAVGTTSAFAQGGGGGGGSGGGGGGGSSGGGGSGLSSSMSGGGSSSSSTNSAFSGLGGSSSGSTSGSGTASTPSKNNPLYTYYGNPLSSGLGQNNTLAPNNSLSGSSASSNGISNFQLDQSLSATQGTLVFGNPLYAQSTTKSSSSLTGSGLGSLGGSGSGVGAFPGVSSYGMRRAPSFATSLAEGVKDSPFSSLVPPPNDMVNNLRDVLGRSTSLKAPGKIRLFMEDYTVILQGEASDHDRRMAEGLIRLTPGVRNVRNEIQVKQATLP